MVVRLGLAFTLFNQLVNEKMFRLAVTSNRFMNQGQVPSPSITCWCRAEQEESVNVQFWVTAGFCCSPLPVYLDGEDWLRREGARFGSAAKPALPPAHVE
jgi:hypothetical protein